MSIPKFGWSFVFIAACAVFAAPARAQFAVIDVPAIVQLVQQVQTMQQELETTRAQLQQAHEALQSMTGDRGMQRLLGGVVRNYLPAGWSDIGNALQTTAGKYASLAVSVRNIVGMNAILTPQDLGKLSPTDRRQIAAARQLAAMAQAVSHDAVANASNRFAALQSLIDAIGGASDQKGILDLQARITAEQGMLQNENTKLQSLYQAMQAQAEANKLQLREQIIAAHGQFARRFQPIP